MNRFMKILFWINIVLLGIGLFMFCTSFGLMFDIYAFVKRIGAGAIVTILSAINIAVFVREYCNLKALE